MLSRRDLLIPILRSGREANLENDARKRILRNCSVGRLSMRRSTETDRLLSLEASGRRLRSRGGRVHYEKERRALCELQKGEGGIDM